MKHDTQIFERSLNINLSLRYEGNNLNGELINCSESAKINPVRDVCRTLLDTHQGFPFQQHLGGIGKEGRNIIVKLANGYSRSLILQTKLHHACLTGFKI